MSHLFVRVFVVWVALAACAAPRAFAIDMTPPDGEGVTSGEAMTQQMDSFTMVGYAADGSKRWDLAGTGAQLDGSIVTINRPNAIGYDVPDSSKPGLTVSGSQVPDGGPLRTAYLTASLAQIEQNTHRIRLEHDVTIHTSDGMWLSSPSMYWLPENSEMVTDQPVRLENAEMVLRGREATAQTELKHATIQRDVELVMHSQSDAPATTEPKAPGNQGIVIITCDGPLHFDYEKNIATFEDNVHVKDSEGDLYSDHLIAYLNENTRGVRYAEATGRVRMVQGGHTAYGQRAVYEPTKRKVTLLGSPSLLLQDEDALP